MINQVFYSQLIPEYKFFEKAVVSFSESTVHPETLHQIRNKKLYRDDKSQSNSIPSKKLSNAHSLLGGKQCLKESFIDKKNVGVNHPIYRMHPIYPDRAKFLRMEGKVTVVYNINNDGRIENIRILYSTPPKIFENNVRVAMMSWVYEREKPKNDLVVTFKFNLHSAKEFKN